MKKFSRTIASIAALAIAASAPCFVSDAGNSALELTAISVSAESGVTYVNADGSTATPYDYTYLDAGKVHFTDGWYVIQGNLKTNSRITVDGDVNFIFVGNSSYTVKGGIEVTSGSNFNVYSSNGANGTLYAGTTTGRNVTADDGLCGIGGRDCTINICGGAVYANGGKGAAGISGRTISLGWTNTTDLISASSYSGTVKLTSVFADRVTGTAFTAGSVSSSALENIKLSAAVEMNSRIQSLDNAAYVVTGNVTVSDRLKVSGMTDIILSDGCVLNAYEGITVPDGATLNIFGSNGTLYAGTTNGSNMSARDYYSGIGSENNSRTGDIIIHGGNIYANGGGYAAGIGGSNAYVEISGGTVNAKGGQYGAGIGSCFKDNGCEVEITGGKVTAMGGSGAAGIGSGSSSGSTSISLGWTKNSDSIYASSYDGNIKFLKSFTAGDTGVPANSGNIGGKTITPSVGLTYSITFESNGGSYVAPVYVNEGKYASAPSVPSKPGFSFGGWYLDKNCTQEFIFNISPVYKNYTLYAKWMSDSHIVSFQTNGGEYVAPLTVNDGGYISRFPTCYKNGFTFEGWYYDNSFTRRAQDTDRIYRDTVLYAKWSSSAHTVSFQTNGGDYVSPITVNNGGYISRFPTCYKYGYTFEGWYYDSSFTRRAQDTDRIYSDTVLFAKWSGGTYTVTFQTNGGGYAAPKQVVSGRQIDVLPYLTRDGYVFEGWFTDANFYYKFNEYAPITGNITLYAKWSSKIMNYTVDFVTNGGSYCSPVVVKANEYIGYLPQPTKSNCTFEGWYTDSSCSSPYQYGPVNRNMTLYARWSEATSYVTVTFNSNGGSYVPAKTVVKGSYISEPSCSREGYRFTGWYTSSSGTGSTFYFGQSIDSNITLYAGWEEDASSYTYKNTYNDEDNNSYSSKNAYNDGYYYAPGQYGSTFAGSGIGSLIAGVIGAAIGAMATLLIKKK